MPFGLTNAPTTFMDLMHKFEDFSRLAAPMTRLTRKESGLRGMTHVSNHSRN